MEKYKMKIKMVIVEDQTLLRDSLRQVISRQDDIEVVGVTDEAAQAPDLCRRLKPDLVLMDVVTKTGPNGISVSTIIRREFPAIKIVIMTGLPEITFVDAARKAGVHSFVYKDRAPEHLLYVIRNTMQGYGIYPGPNDQSGFTAQFTEKEIEIIGMVCKGKAREDMAKELGISERYLGQYITAILDKSGFDNILKFAVYASSQGLIVVDNDT
jgi:DNA-binding NarL/FixJ family response regulator